MIIPLREHIIAQHIIFAAGECIIKKHPLCHLRERHRGCLFVSDDLTLCGERA